MVDKSVSVRFYIARKGVSGTNYSWPPQAILRSLLHPTLPAIGANGVTVTYSNESYLVETAAYDANSVLHIQISRDMEEVPAVRNNQRTGPMRLAAGQVPASVSHLTFLPSGVVAVVRGVASPGPHQSAGILSQVTGVPFALEALTRSDQLLALNNSTGASTVEFSATVIDPQVATGDPVLEAARRMLGQQDFEVTVRLTARGRGGKVSLRRFARRLIDGQSSDQIELRRGIAKLTATGQAAREVDLIEDQIVEKRVITLSVPAGQQLVTLTVADVLEVVREAYNDLGIVVGSALATTPSDFPE